MALLLHRGKTAADTGYPNPTLCHAECNTLADSLTAAGDDGYLFVELFHMIKSFPFQ